MMTSRKWHGALVCLAVAACVQPLDTQRRVQGEQTPGQAIYQELCQRVAFADDRRDVAGVRARSVCRDGAMPMPAQGARLYAMHAQRDRIIEALDFALADGRSADTLDMVGALEPLLDDGVVRAALHAQSESLDAFLAAPESLHAMERVAARRGHVPYDMRMGALLAAMRYPALDAFAGSMLPLVSTGGRARSRWRALLNITEKQLTHDAAALTAPADGELAALRAFLLAPAGDTQPLQSPSVDVTRLRNRMRGNAFRHERVLTVLRDDRGVARVAERDGRLPAPFVDLDGDGLPDVDASGVFVNAAGGALFVATPFAVDGADDGFDRDALGRALGGNGQPLYVYEDLGSSLLARTLSQGAALIDADRAQAVAWAPALRGLLGAPVLRTHRFGAADATERNTLSFRGYEVEKSPLLDLMQSLSALASKDVMPQMLELAQLLASANEKELAALVNLGWRLRDWYNAPDMADVTLAPGNVFADDMIEVLTEIARVPGLLDDVMTSMANPNSAKSGALFAKQMRHADRVNLDPNNVNGPPVGGFNTPVDRTMADVGENESVFQRIIHLVHDAYELPICNPELPLGRYVYKPCEMFQIDDAAVFYVQAIAGNAQMRMRLTQEDADDFLLQAEEAGLEFMEHMTGLKGFERISFTRGETPDDLSEFVYSVTPQASTRLLFAPSNPNIVDPETAQRLAIAHLILGDQILDDGETFATKHRGTLFAWELEGFFDSVRPLMQAFANHDAEHLICKVVNVLFMHYATKDSTRTTHDDPNRHDYAHPTGLRNFEPVIAKMLDEGRALQIVGELTQAASQLNVGHGAVPRFGNKVMAEMAREMLVPERTPGLTFYNGDTSTQKNDGSQVVSSLSPTLLLKSAMGRMSGSLDALAKDSAARRLPLAAARAYLTVDGDPDDGYRFRNRGIQNLSKAYLSHLQSRLQAHTEADDLDAWSQAWPDDLRDTLAHPMTGAVLDLLALVAEDRLAAEAVGDLTAYMMGPARADLMQAAHGALVALTDTHNAAPLLRASAAMFMPDAGLLDRTVGVLQAAQPLDTAQAMPALLGALATPNPWLGSAPLTVLLDAFVDVNRVHPGVNTALSADDFGSFLRQARDFLLDETMGLARLLTLAEGRYVARNGEAP